MTTELHEVAGARQPDAGAREAGANLKERAEALLAGGVVKAVLGWRGGLAEGQLQPTLFERVEELGDLLIQGEPGLNLAVYLRRAAVRRLFPVSIVTRPGDLRSIVVLIQEGQLTAEDVRPLLFDVDSATVLPGDTLPELLPWLLAHYPARDFTADRLEPVLALDRLTPAERWEYWKEQFRPCLRCYACREACPLCYCERCIVDLTQPPWLEPSAHPRGCLNWNLIRAYHLAGRCTLCGACQSACPVNIPLMVLNRMLAHHILKEFDFTAGLDPAGPALLAGWRREDPNGLFG
jgi:ferredoxin